MASCPIACTAMQMGELTEKIAAQVNKTSDLMPTTGKFICQEVHLPQNPT